MEIKNKKQWHPVFCTAMELEFREDNDILEYYREHNLSKKPLQIDLLVIKKEPDRKLKNEIGDFFLGHNIMEYKSPEDGLDIDTFYKVLGYACLYKHGTGKTDEVLDTDITISLIRESRPVKLIKQLSQKYTVTKKSAGIYRIGNMLFPLQILVTKELDPGLHTWLPSLTRSMGQGEAEKLLNSYGSLENSRDRRNANVVVDFVSNLNETLFMRILKEDERMTEALKELVEPDLKELRLVIDNKDAIIADKDAEIADKDAEIADKDAEIADKDAEIADKDAEIARLKQQLSEAGHLR